MLDQVLYWWLAFYYWAETQPIFIQIPIGIATLFVSLISIAAVLGIAIAIIQGILAALLPKE